MPLPIVEVRAVSKRYQLGAIGATSLRDEARRYWDRLRGVPHPDAREFWALRDVSMSIQPGEVVGIIGHNGAGKSTLLKILSRITEPTTGSAVIRGRVASLLEVGTGFHPELSGRENVYLNGAILGMSRAEVRAKFDEIVAFAEVGQFIDTPVKRYSSGMYVRLAFAVAAHLDPEILIVDEVLAVGDAQFQQKCLGRMREDARSGRTILFVSHQLNAIAQFCQRCIRLKGGMVVDNGPPDEVIPRYFATDQTRQAVLDLAAPRRASDCRGQARLESVRLVNGRAGSEWSLSFAQPPVFELEIAIAAAFSSLEFGVCFIDPGGEEVFSSLSSWSKDPGPFQPGRVRVRVECPRVNFAPGIYYVHLGIRSAFGTEDYLTSACSFEIMPVHDPRWPGAERMSGIVRQDSVYTILP
jgi:lipopolysaccharide transport system ATP-binding protein